MLMLQNLKLQLDFSQNERKPLFHQWR